MSCRGLFLRTLPPARAFPLFGLFSDRPFAVSDVEAAVGRGALDGAALEAALPGARVKAIPVEVGR